MNFILTVLIVALIYASCRVYDACKAGKSTTRRKSRKVYRNSESYTLPWLGGNNKKR